MRAVFILLMFWCCALVASAEVPALKNAAEVAGGTGLKVRALRGGQAVQSVAPKALYYRFKRGTETWKETHFDVREFWHTAQHGCRWKDSKGNELVVASLVAPLPDVGAEHAKREDITAKMNETADAFKNPSDEALAGWVAAYSGTAVEAAALKELSVSSLTAARTVDFGTANRAAVLFQVKSGAWHYAEFSFAQPVRPAEVARLEKQFLSTVTETGAAAGPVKEGGWLTMKVPGYVFKTDLFESQAKAFLKNTGRQMEAMQAAYRRYVPPTKKLGESTIRVFATQKGYDEYLARATGKEPGRTIGLWSPSHEELLILDMGKSARDETTKILRHEAFHQYLFYATGGERHAVWFNEGHACLFENVLYDAKRNAVRVTDDPRDRRPAAVGAAPERYAAMVPEILTLDYEAFYAGDLKEVNERYAAAWALVYFLQKGVPTFAEFAAYREVLPTYRQALLEGASANEASRRAWETVGKRNFVADFAKFWNKRTAAKNYEPPTNPECFPLRRK